MNLVAIDNATNNVLESQRFTDNKEHIRNIVAENLASSELTPDKYNFQEMTDNELQQYIME